MDIDKAKEAVDTYVNGNITIFKEWLKTCDKIDIIEAIEYYSCYYGSRHIIINTIRQYLIDMYIEE